MFRRLFNFLAIISLLLCGLAAGLWWRSWHHSNFDEDRYSWMTSRGDRCTIRSDAGRVTLFEPPAGNANATAKLPLSVTAPKNTADYPMIWPRPYPDPTFQFHRLQAAGSLPTARETAAAIRNDQYEWSPLINLTSSADVTDNTPMAQCWTRVGSASFLFAAHMVREEQLDESWFPAMQQLPPAFSTPDAVAALLPALEDPQRFVAAHVLLMHLIPQVTSTREYFPRVNDVLAIGGLRVELKQNDPSEWVASSLFFKPHYDPSQLPAIRDQWHRRLDVPAYSSPWWTLTAATATLPLVWIVRFGRRKRIRRWRRRTGRCFGCGYDLQASLERCPECGAAPQS